MKSLFLAVALAASLAGCAGVSPETPQQAVFSVKSGYATALTAAVAYKRLPACGEPKRLPCSDAKIVAQIQKADNVAAGALDAAETAVRTPGFGKDAVSSALAAARAALAALVSITATIGS
jgi:hypothetical protein